ncbi:lipopolysaccharide biosynthesis protein [Nostoc sp. JL33]|uniref:lipopolysaccharide biosynthesis protein n=1 Tax=Nostoc sp. JL33 TaxID=2815396 RepID=UPI0025CF9DF2|nr:polysaccharide biosynthesis protein [Nostoc sp. JL33]MBN3870640.1 polysaccharide biosynthesis protein [Nostoc sp. JL33]
MKNLWPNFVHRLKIIGKFASIQIVVQALSLVSGILLVRTLDQQQYAYFTIANTMQSTMNLLADTGISMSLSTIGGKVWQDRYRFGQLINTAMQLRYYLAATSISIVTPILIWMLIRNGASLTYAVLITFVVLFGLSFQLTTDVLLVIPRLHSQINKIQNLDLFSSVTRLTLLGISYIFYLNSVVAIGIYSIIIVMQRIMLGRWANEKIDSKASINQEDKKHILVIIKHQVPNTIYYCLQGQLMLYLITLFGDTNNIAEIGALGRLGIVFSLITAVMSNIVLPSISRCQSASLLRKYYLQVLSILFIIAGLMISCTLLFTDQILWILGSKYTSLHKELVLIVINSLFSSIVGIMWSINASKAWINYSWINIPFTLSVQIVLLLVLDLSSVLNVITFNLISQFPAFIVNIYLTNRGIAEYESA